MTAVTRIVAVLIALLSVAVWTQVPDRRAPDLGVGPDRAPSSSAACPVVTGRDARSEALVGTRLAGAVRFVVESGGVELTDGEVTTEEQGGASIDISELVGASTVGLVIDLPEDGASASIVTSSELILAAAMCTPPVAGETAIAGWCRFGV